VTAGAAVFQVFRVNPRLFYLSSESKSDAWKSQVEIKIDGGSHFFENG
jgi:hypothetical protein